MKNQSSKKKNKNRKKGEVLDLSDEELEDISVIGNSLSISVKGLRELIRALSDGTEEFKELMTNECSLIYECKICQSLFRSVANFISHKRRFCKRRFQQFIYKPDNEPGVIHVEEAIKPIESVEKEKRNLILPRVPPKDLPIDQSTVNSNLEKTELIKSVVFQTLVQNQNNVSVRQELRELEQCNIPEATILADGTVAVSGNDEQFKCKGCNVEFSTSRALERHTNVYHQARTCYPCPLCKVFFVSPWCVYRHLNKVHHKREDQIRRLRQAVLTKAVRRELYQPPRVISDSQQTSATKASKRAEDEKWIAQFDTDLHCKTCNRSFSRRAALNVHAVMCKSRPKPRKPTEKSPSVKQAVSLRCAKCHKDFGRRAVLSAHESRCNGTALQQHLHICKFCGLSFPSRRPLTEHIAACPRAPNRSPLRHLLTPPRLSAAPRPQLSSPVPMPCDYNMMPRLFAPHANISSDPVLPSKLETVVQKLHDNPPNSAIVSPTAQSTNKITCSTNPVIKANSRLILSPSGTFNVSLTAKNRNGFPPNGKIFISVPSSATVSSSGTKSMPIIASLIPVIDIDPPPLSPSPKLNFIAKSSQSPGMNISSISTPSFITVQAASKIVSPNVVNGISTDFHGESNASDKDIEVITIPDCQSPTIISSPSKDGLSAASNHSIYSSSALSTSTISADPDELNGDSLYSTPIDFSEENNHETDSNLTSRELEDNSDSGSTKERVLAEDSGLSDDGSLPENVHREMTSPFEGFDPATAQDLLPFMRLNSLVNSLDAQLNSSS